MAVLNDETKGGCEQLYQFRSLADRHVRDNLFLFGNKIPWQIDATGRAVLQHSLRHGALFIGADETRRKSK